MNFYEKDFPKRCWPQDIRSILAVADSRLRTYQSPPVLEWWRNVEHAPPRLQRNLNIPDGDGPALSTVSGHPIYRVLRLVPLEDALENELV